MRARLELGFGLADLDSNQFQGATQYIVDDNPISPGANISHLPMEVSLGNGVIILY